MMDARNTRVAALTVENGGGTFDALNDLPFAPKDGYAVAVANGFEGPATHFMAEHMGTYGRHVAGEFGTPWYGTWLDSGRLYIDPVRYIRDRAEAMQVARDKGQKAIFDFALGVAVITASED
jgi:hypothetical protein